MPHRYAHPLLAALALYAAAAHAGSYTLGADLWMQPRSGAEVAAMPPVRAAVQDWLRHPGARLVILHSGDELGGLWASELAEWLISLGVPAERIEKRVSGQNEDALTLVVEP